MEIKEGIVVETLVDKKDVNGVDVDVCIPKGTRGLVCDASHIAEGAVLVEIYGDGIPQDAWGVYEYALSELRVAAL